MTGKKLPEWEWAFGDSVKQIDLPEYNANLEVSRMKPTDEYAVTIRIRGKDLSGEFEYNRTCCMTSSENLTVTEEWDEIQILALAWAEDHMKSLITILGAAVETIHSLGVTIE